MSLTEVIGGGLCQYEAQGFWMGPKLFADSDIHRLRAEIERFVAGWEGPLIGTGGHQVRIDNSETTGIFHVDQAWAVSDVVRRFVLSPELGYIASRLMRTEQVRLWGDFLIYKPAMRAGARAMTGPGARGRVGWHQDRAYWASVQGDTFCTAWISGQQTTPDRGGMHWVVGSHKWGLLPGSRAFFDQDLERLQQEFSSGRSWQEVACQLGPGEVSFHHPLCLHGAEANKSDEPLMALAVHYVAGSSTVRLTEPIHPNLRAVERTARHGDPLPANAFPIVWPPRVPMRETS